MRKERRMNPVLSALIGYGIGVLVSVLLFRPIKSYKDGFEAAEKFYKDWDGGFRSGWDAAFRQMEKIALAWNHREERKEE